MTTFHDGILLPYNLQNVTVFRLGRNTIGRMFNCVLYDVRTVTTRDFLVKRGKTGLGQPDARDFRSRLQRLCIQYIHTGIILVICDNVSKITHPTRAFGDVG